MLLLPGTAAWCRHYIAPCPVYAGKQLVLISLRGALRGQGARCVTSLQCDSLGSPGALHVSSMLLLPPVTLTASFVEVRPVWVRFARPWSVKRLFQLDAMKIVLFDCWYGSTCTSTPSSLAVMSSSLPVLQATVVSWNLTQSFNTTLHTMMVPYKSMRVTGSVELWVHDVLNAPGLMLKSFIRG